MAIYKYKGVNVKGKNVNGVIDAESSKAARMKLKQKGIYATNIVDKGVADTEAKKKTLSISIGKGVKASDITVFTRQFATLINANIPIVDTLEALSNQVENDKLKIILKETKQKVNEGGTIADAFSEHPKIFPPIYINMIKAGEASGTLGLVLERLADYTQGQTEFRNKLISSMAYPVLMIIISVVIISILFVFVIPKITTVFENSEITLPIYTVILISISEFMRNNLLLLIGGVIVFIFLFRKYITSKSGKKKWDAFKLKLPLFGNITRMTSVSQFTRTLSTLIGTGVPLLQALDIVLNVVQNEVVKKALRKAKELVSEGESLAKTLEDSGQFPAMVIHMITVGEKTGELSKMLSHVSNTYEREVETKINTITSLLEPLMILVMGGSVAFVVMAILMPIMQMSNIS
jgi:general secretion pathway protein F